MAAGAIAEKYLKLAYGVEIVAFVSSVGKVQLPSAVSPPSQVPPEDDDAVEDALSPEFMRLLGSVNREQVDAFQTRCPHAETSERMVKVRIPSSLPHPKRTYAYDMPTIVPPLPHPLSASSAPKRRTTPSAAP